MPDQIKANEVRLPEGVELADISALRTLERNEAIIERNKKELVIVMYVALESHIENRSLTPQQIREARAAIRKIQKCADIASFLKKQGPFSEDDPDPFHLTDAEIEALVPLRDIFVETANDPSISMRALLENSFQNSFFFHSVHWRRNSKRIYNLSDDWQQKFITSYEGVTWGDLVLPHSSFIIQLSPPRLIEKGKYILTGLLVSRPNEMDEHFDEDVIHIRAILSETTEDISRRKRAEREFPDHKKDLERSADAWENGIGEVQKGLLKDKTKRRMKHWGQRQNQYTERNPLFKRALEESVIQVNLNDPIGQEVDTKDITERLKQFVAGTCLFLMNSEPEEKKDSGGAPLTVTVSDLEIRDTARKIHFNPQRLMNTPLAKRAREAVKPHKRSAHERTIHRDTPRERVVDVRETTVKGRYKPLPKKFTFGVSTAELSN